MNDEYVSPINLEEAADMVFDWNLRLGNPIDQPSWENIFSQNKVDMEECKELYYAILTVEALRKGVVNKEQLGDYDPYLEVLDGVTDKIVTTTGLITMLEGIGFPIEEAFMRIMDNNELKIYDNKQEASLECQRFIDETSIDAGVVTYVDYEGAEWFCVRDGDGKIRKAIDHPQVDLSDLVEGLEGAQ